MKYLTPAQVKAKVKGPRSALRVSIQKHKQRTRMPKADFRRMGPGSIDERHCGLCVWYKDCLDCPMCQDNPCDNWGSIWRELRDALPYKDNDYPAFISASKKMVEVLESLL